MKIVFTLGFFAFVSISAFANDVQPLPDGIALTVDQLQVELRVASPHAFRLHIFSPSTAHSTPSLFLSEKAQPATPYSQVSKGSAVGIKTAFGELLVDPAAKKWTLLDSAGNALADWAPLAELTGSSIHLSVGPSPATPSPLYYGSGNVPNLGALIQTEADSRTGNGSTSLPQYWSTAHYGSLMISAIGNQPGSWKANGAGGIDWTVPGVSADLYLMPAENLYDWIRDDAELTGFAPVPPRWALGYFQSRWGWTDKAYIDDALARFRKDNLPVDTFIIDFEWYTKTPDYDVQAPGDPNFVDFGWNPALFPDPVSQIADFAQQGLHIVGIRKPRIGNSENLAMARRKGWILPVNPDDPNNDNIRSRDLDYSNPEVRAWWEENNRKFLEAGMAAFWNDEGEANYTEYSYWNMAEVDLLKQVDPEARFWSINRSFVPGMQRFGAAVWTGDINADWDTLAKTPGQLLSYALSGMPYSACDIGGFSGDPTPELLTRWMEAGVFFPVMRSHSSNGSTPHFPWLFGPEAEAAIQKALNLRYRLIPYYYSLDFENHLTGAPLMRPLVMEFPDDAKVSGRTDEWLMGKGLLAAPIMQQGGARDVYLPNDRWFAFGTNQMTRGPQTVHLTSKLDEIPLYVRAGTLLPLGPVLQYTGQASDEPLELQIYPGHDGTFTFAEDDGKTLDYQKGAVRFLAFSWNDQTKTLSWKISGNYNGDKRFTKMKAVLFGPQGPIPKEAPFLNLNGSIIFR